MLEERGIEYRYREYTREPLDESELTRLFGLLGVRPGDLLRRRDRAFKELGLTGEEADGELVRHMAAHPTLLERPIGVLGDHAVVGRPPARLLELVAGSEERG